MAHWGKQTFDQALALETPRLLGLSHRQYSLRGNYKGKTKIVVSVKKSEAPEDTDEDDDLRHLFFEGVGEKAQENSISESKETAAVPEGT